MIDHIKPDMLPPQTYLIHDNSGFMPGFSLEHPANRIHCLNACSKEEAEKQARAIIYRMDGNEAAEKAKFLIQWSGCL
jgi:hypothetical protein